MAAAGMRKARQSFVRFRAWDKADPQAGLIERHPEVSRHESYQFDPTDPAAPFQGRIRGVPRARNAKHQGRGGLITDDAQEP